MRLDPSEHAFLSAPDTRAVLDAISPGERIKRLQK